MPHLRKIILSLLLISFTLHAVPPSEGFRIKYISAENVYLDGGSYDGLMTGDTLRVGLSESEAALLKITYVSESSAACTIIASGSDIHQGDYAVPVTLRQIQTAVDNKNETEKITAPRSRPRPQPGPLKKQRRTRVSGTASLQWFHMEEPLPGGYQFDQPALRFQLKVRDFLTEGLRFQVRFRSRQTLRSSNFQTRTSRGTWDNRLYSVYMEYDKTGAPWSFSTGRLIANHLSGLGAFDGMDIRRNFGGTLQIGMIAGTEPQWQYGASDFSQHKYAVYLRILRGVHYTRRFESTWALSGAYHERIISRESVYVQNQLNWDSFTLFQSLEADIYRGWRREKAGTAFMLTNLYLLSDLKLTDWLSAGVSYDNRRQIWTYRIRTLEDSLYDEAFRQGIRSRLKIRLPYSYHLSLDAGFRKEERSARTARSGSVRLVQSRLFLRGMSLSLAANAYTNMYTQGQFQSETLSWTVHRLHHLSTGFSRSVYTFLSSPAERGNHRWQMDAYIQLPAGFYLAPQYEYIRGADNPGHQIFAEAGIRF